MFLLLCSWRKNPPVPIEYEAGWAPESVKMLGEERSLVPVLESIP